MYYIASNYHLYFIVDIDTRKKVVKVYSMPFEKQESFQDMTYEEFDPLWSTYTQEDQEILQGKFIPSQLLKMEIPYSQYWISHNPQKALNFWCNRILLKQSKGNSISISKGCVSFRMQKYERVRDFISFMGSNESVFPYVITNKQVYCVDYVPYTVDKKYSQDPYNPNIPIHEITHQILIDPPDVTDVWWDDEDSK